LNDDDPTKDVKLLHHAECYPNESSPLIDTASTLGGRARSPPTPAPSFIPVGHISLDSESPEPGLCDPSQGIYAITSFYISRALQGGGLGRAAMDAVEEMGSREPLCAKALSLDTLAKEISNDTKFWEWAGLEPPKITNQEWYERRGYKVFRTGASVYVEESKDLQAYDMRCVFMRKSIV
jgi:GNAT superfamily N-acetyltransferase